MNCEFRANGKLRGGTVIEDFGENYRIEYHGPKRVEIIINKSKIKLLNQQEPRDEE